MTYLFSVPKLVLVLPSSTFEATPKESLFRQLPLCQEPVTSSQLYMAHKEFYEKLLLSIFGLGAEA